MPGRLIYRAAGFWLPGSLAVLAESHVHAEKRSVGVFEQILPDRALLRCVAIGVVVGAPRLAQQAHDVLACGTANLDL
jgi:hypothetical protein